MGIRELLPTRLRVAYILWDLKPNLNNLQVLSYVFHKVFATQLADSRRGLPSYGRLKGAGVRAVTTLDRERRKSTVPTKTEILLRAPSRRPLP